MDVESQMKSERPRARFLDVFLVSSVVLLFLAVVAIVVMGTMTVTKIEAKTGITLRTSADPIKEHSFNTPYMKQNFAYIQPTSSELQNDRTMSWRSIDSGPTNSIGGLYAYDDTKSTLQIKRGGMYFLYVELHFYCTANCQEGRVAVHVMRENHNLLTCEVALPKLTDDKVEVSERCWKVTHLSSDSQLLSKMVVSNSGFWKLDLNKSGMGIFLVGSD